MENDHGILIYEKECMDPNEETEKLALGFITGERKDMSSYAKAIQKAPVWNSPKPIDSYESAKEFWVRLHPWACCQDVKPMSENVTQTKAEDVLEKIKIGFYRSENVCLFRFMYSDLICYSDEYEVDYFLDHDAAIIVDRSTGKLINAFCLSDSRDYE